jgi:hypothetical protein
LQQEVSSTGKPGADELALLPDPGRMELADEDQTIFHPDNMHTEDIPCPCGDEAHKNLEKWYEEYSHSYFAAQRGLFDDKFDDAILKEKFELLLPQVPVSNNYCPNCQNLLEKMSEIVEKVPGHQPDAAGELYQQPHFKDTFEFEAGYRNGYRLCTLWVRCSFIRGHSLEVWHRLQTRVDCLRKSTVILVSVRSKEDHFRLTLTWPGQKGDRYSPTVPLYCVKNYDQSMFPILSWVE